VISISFCFDPDCSSSLTRIGFNFDPSSSSRLPLLGEGVHAKASFGRIGMLDGVLEGGLTLLSLDGVRGGVGVCL
jgi:hypothetical protein